jgi:hypothetical protein
MLIMVIHKKPQLEGKAPEHKLLICVFQDLDMSVNGRKN